MEENKKNLTPYIVIAVIIIAAVAGIIFYLSRQTRIAKETKPSTSGPGFPAPEVTAPGTGPKATVIAPGTPLAGAPEKKLLQLTDFPVVSPALNASGDGILFYARSGGNIFQSDFNAQEQKKITRTTIVGLLEATWSPKKDRAIAWYLDKMELKKFIHLVATTTGAFFLDNSTKTASWSPDGSLVAYILPAGKDYTLVTSDASGRNQRVRFRTPIPDFRINWIAPQKISLESASSGLAPSLVYLLDVATGSLSKILDNIYGLTVSWSPDAKKLIYSSTNTSGGDLSLYLKKIGGPTTKLSPTTFPEKCAWSSDSKKIFCAVPNTVPSGVLPDEYYRGLVSFSDKFVKINPDTAETSELLNEGDFDAQNIIVTPGERYLIFVNRKDGTLWRINLTL